MDNFINQIGLYALPLSGSTLLAYGVYQLILDLRKSDQKRVLDRLTDRVRSEERKSADSILRRRYEPKTAISTALARLSVVSWLQRALDQACIEWSAPRALLNLVTLALFAFVGLYMLQWNPIVAACIAAALVLMPLAVIHVKRKMRLNRMMNQLPDVFELMSQALRAGHSLANAIHLVGQQLPDPAGTEFAIVFQEQNLGVKIEDALKNMADRLDLMDVRFFVTAVLIQRTTGGDLAAVLDNISAVIRDRIKLFGQVKALTAEGRLSGWVLFALPIAVFGMEMVVNPDYGRVLLEDPIGRYCLIGAGVSQLLGLAMIQKIVNIKV